MSDTKVCTFCKTAKPLGDFTKNATRGDGYENRCSPCRKVSRAAASPLVDHVAGMVTFGAPLEQAAGEAYARTGSFDAAAAELGITPRALRARLQDLARQAARRGWAPGSDMTRPVPEGFAVKGVSTQYGADGAIVSQWVKSNRAEADKLEMLAEAVSRIAEPFRGGADPVPMPGCTSSDIMNFIPLGDPHLGMYAWAAETGASFDLDIAEANLVAAVDHLIEGAPPADHCVVANMGDFFHVDSGANTTTAGTRQDVDTRWPKVLQVGIRTMRRCIDRALTRHKRVTVINEIGNHDDNSSIMLAQCLANFYEREPRVTVDTSPESFHWIRFGKCLIGTTHKPLKPEQLLAIMANDRAKDWGETLYRHVYCGHVHHDSSKELPGFSMETLRTLAASDRYHRSSGYRSGRDLKMDTWHLEYGRINRITAGIFQVMARQAA